MEPTQAQKAFWGNVHGFQTLLITNFSHMRK